MTRSPSPAPWTRLAVRLPVEAAEVFGVLCIELGAPGAVLGERDLRRTSAGSRASGRTRFEAYFPPSIDPAALAPRVRDSLRALSGEFAGIDPEAARLTPFPLPDYGTAWRAHFPPLRVGRRLLLVPPWIDPTLDAPPRGAKRSPRRGADAGGARPAKGRIAIEIDPGQAFGTGHHPTTRGCLVAIERLCADSPPRRGLDVGSGTGVLAIAMRKFGVARVVAVDDDPLARAATGAAARANRTPDIAVRARVESVRGRFDLVVANLFAGLLVALAPRLRSRLAPGGHLVVSGLLAGQEEAVRAGFAAVGLAVVRRQARSTWVTLELAAHKPVARATASRATGRRTSGVRRARG